MRVSKIINVEFVAKVDGIIGCDRPSRVDWGVVPIGREVVEVYGAPRTTTWKEKLADLAQESAIFPSFRVRALTAAAGVLTADPASAEGWLTG